jgi:enoyl-[acyl-carrier protein] reductase III
VALREVSARGWALVTGASGDIGSTVATRLAAAGHPVVLHCFRRTERAESIAAGIRDGGGRAQVLRANFAASGATARFAAEVAELTGGVEILVAAAASGVMRPVSELTERHWDWTLAVNTRPLALLATTLRPRATVALTSPGSVRVVDGYAAVGASKAAMEAVVRYLAVELAPAGRVNALCVGLVDGRAARLLPDWPGLRADTEARTPMGRLVTPDDVADVVSFLAAPAAAMLTGATVVLDGGRTLTFP